MDDNIRDSGADGYTEIIVRIPDDLARRLGTVSEIERPALEALARRIQARPPDKVRNAPAARLPHRMKLDEFLKAHGVCEPHTLDDLEREREDLAAIAPDEKSR